MLTTCRRCRRSRERCGAVRCGAVERPAGPRPLCPQSDMPGRGGVFPVSAQRAIHPHLYSVTIHTHTPGGCSSVASRWARVGRARGSCGVQTLPADTVRRAVAKSRRCGAFASAFCCAAWDCLVFFFFPLLFFSIRLCTGLTLHVRGRAHKRNPASTRSVLFPNSPPTDRVLLLLLLCPASQRALDKREEKEHKTSLGPWPLSLPSPTAPLHVANPAARERAAWEPITASGILWGCGLYTDGSCFAVSTRHVAQAPLSNRRSDHATPSTPPFVFVRFVICVCVFFFLCVCDWR